MKLKRILIALILVFTMVTAGWAISTFTWDANTEPDLAGYHLYRSDTSGVYTLELIDGRWVGSGWIADIPAGTETFDYTVPEGTWYFVMTAYDTSDNESGPSNEVSQTTDTTPPDPPTGLQCN